MVQPLLSTFEKMGFKLNPYDGCVRYKMINRRQCAIVFYVDSNNISHGDAEVVSGVIDEILKHFKKLKVTCGGGT